MTVSVVMATYNGAQYIEEQLDSILHQTLPPDEVVICDDRSKDNTVEVVEEYIKRNQLEKSWYIVMNEHNMGYADNFDKVTRMATKDLIFFSDQDDIWEPDKIQVMTDIMKKEPGAVVLCTDYYPWYDSENAPKAPKRIMQRMPDNGVLENVKLSKSNIYIGALGCCMCVRRDFYFAIRKYWFDGWAQDDRMWKMAQSAHGCFILHSNLVRHRLHDNNTATYGKYHTIDRRVKLFKEMRDAEEQMLLYLEEHNGSEKEKLILKRHVVMMEKRIELLEQKKFFNVIPLIRYLPYYERKKSYFVEVIIALKGKRTK